MPDFVDEILDTLLLCTVSSGFFTRRISAVPDISTELKGIRLEALLHQHPRLMKRDTMTNTLRHRN